jgi:hypothetical protein
MKHSDNSRSNPHTEKLGSCQRTSEQALLECMIEARKELVAVGLMEQAKDLAGGTYIYHD